MENDDPAPAARSGRDIARVVSPTEALILLSDKLEQIVASYFADLRDKRQLGAGTPERSYYPAVAKLLDAIGQQLKPEVLCLSDLGNTGSGQPDLVFMPPIRCKRASPVRDKRRSAASLK
jgi:hypothetical protein